MINNLLCPLVCKTAQRCYSNDHQTTMMWNSSTTRRGSYEICVAIGWIIKMAIVIQYWIIKAAGDVRRWWSWRRLGRYGTVKTRIVIKCIFVFFSSAPSSSLTNVLFYDRFVTWFIQFAQHLFSFLHLRAGESTQHGERFLWRSLTSDLSQLVVD